MDVAQDIEQLNSDCTCITLDRDTLCRALVEVVGDPAFCSDLVATRPYLVSSQPFFLTADHASSMRAIIAAIEHVATLPAYNEAVLGYAPEIARHRPGPIGVFMGYDFHLGPDGPKLIEINTNAGGALINAYLLKAQHACCAAMAVSSAPQVDIGGLLQAFVDGFRSEWSLQRGTRGPASIAIVDEDPQSQYLHPEFVLFERLFRQHGIAAHIAAPGQLSYRDAALWLGNERIDLVYNRLTDFDLSAPDHRSLRDAYLAGHVVMTPGPWAHARFADKRNLTLLSDEATLRSWGVAGDIVDVLMTGVPRTMLVTPSTADELWSRRNGLFFKPCSGYGGKAAYRGDKMTRKVWADVLSHTYVAQDLVTPSARNIAIDGQIESLKADLRCYTYAGSVQLIAARLYRGQTTNFRTPGGGFAPVFVGQTATCTC
jgi:hypothetical protein